MGMPRKRKMSVHVYTLRIYNEGQVDGYASSVTDYLPPQLEFVIDETTGKYKMNEVNLKILGLQ